MERIVVYEAYDYVAGCIILGIFIGVGFWMAYYGGRKKILYAILGTLGVLLCIFGLLSANLESLQKPVNQYLVDKKVIPQIDFGRYQVIGQQGDTFLLERIEHTKTFRVSDRR